MSAGDVPNWPTIEEFPLHGGSLEEGWWWGCEHPERPPDEGCTWDARCDKCMMHAAAGLSTGTADITTGVNYLTGEMESEVISLRRVVDGAAQWREEHT